MNATYAQILRATPSERVKMIEGTPKASAKKIQHGFMQKVIWEYRGYHMMSRKQPGWNSGSEWRTTNHPTQNYTSSSKLELMLKIDRELAKMYDDSKTDWEMFNERNGL